MYVQWCIKGVSGIDEAAAESIVIGGSGLQCRWWRNVHAIQPDQVAAKLTPDNLDLHVNHYGAPDPATGQPFCDGTPFISLTAGAVDRDTVLETNKAVPARQTALRFATRDGTNDGYLFYCYVIVGLGPAVPVTFVAEEVRGLSPHRNYSRHILEGEIAAKIHVPANQISMWERYSIQGGVPVRDWVHWNTSFEDPMVISNIRGAF
jgi:hypothetical protein